MDEAIRLRNASMVIGLSGWVNAGEVSTLSVGYLVEKLEARPLGEIASEPFHAYQLQRPLVSIEGGLVRAYEPPSNKLYYWRDEKGERGLVLLIGVEPHLDWPGYARAVLEAAEAVGVRRIYTLGGYIGGVSHTSEPVITGSASGRELLGELRRTGVELTTYQGPTGVYSEVLWQGRARGIGVVSLWGAVPPYVQGPYPKVAHRLLRTVVSLTGVEVDLTEVERRADALDARLDAEAESNPELRQLISGLESEYRASRAKLSYTV